VHRVIASWIFWFIICPSAILCSFHLLFSFLFPLSSFLFPLFPLSYLSLFSYFSLTFLLLFSLCFSWASSHLFFFLSFFFPFIRRFVIFFRHGSFRSNHEDSLRHQEAFLPHFQVLESGGIANGPWEEETSRCFRGYVILVSVLYFFISLFISIHQSIHQSFCLIFKSILMIFRFGFGLGLGFLVFLFSCFLVFLFWCFS